MKNINHNSIHSDNLNTINQPRCEKQKSIDRIFNLIEERQKANNLLFQKYLLDCFTNKASDIHKDVIRQKVLNDLSSQLNHEAFIRLMSIKYSKQ